MKITVLGKFGGVEAVVTPDLLKAELTGIGQAEIVWANRRPEAPVINFLRVSKYRPAYQPLLQWLAARGVKVTASEIRIQLSPQAVEALTSALRRVYEEFEKALLAGEIPVRTVLVGVDNPRVVLKPAVKEYNGFPVDEMFYHIVDEKYGLREWSGSPDRDVTAEVVAELLRRRAAQEAAKQNPRPRTVRCWECGREYAEDEARRLVRSGVARWEEGSFYCGC